MSRVLITGAMGFLGQQCVKKFLSEGYEVITTDKAPGAQLMGDITNAQFVRSLPAVDSVVNCAAVQYVTQKKPFLRKKFFYENNVVSTKLLSEKYNETSHFVHVGTSMMYQSGKDALTETSLLAGNGIYSQSKYEAQKHVVCVRNSATIIPCIIGGIGREGLFRPFVKMIKSSPFVLIPGDGAKPIHMVHVEDVSNLICLIVSKKLTGLYNAASPEPLTIRDWIQVIASKIARPKPRVISIPMGLVSNAAAITAYRLLAKEQVLMLKERHVLSIEKSLGIGWKPKYSNFDVVEQMAAHLNNN